MKLHRRYIKSYRKATLAILSSITLTIALVVCLLVTTHTDDEVQALQYQYINGGHDVSLKGLNDSQIRTLEKNKNISHLALSEILYQVSPNGKQYAMVAAGNRDSILSTSKLLEGRLPVNGKELVAEKWVLANLDIAPKLNTEIMLKTSDPTDPTSKEMEKKYKIVGIISDIALYKTNGQLYLNTALEKENYKQVIADIKFDSGINVKKELGKIKKDFKLKKDQIHYNQYVLDATKSTFDFNKNEMMLILLLLSICTIVILGVYRISILSRNSQYGVLRALGMKKVQILKLITAELFELYLVAVPMGTVLGLVISYIIGILSNDKALTLIFWGKEVPFHLDIPVIEISLYIFGVGIMVCLIAWIAYRKIYRGSIVAKIFGISQKDQAKHIFPIKTFGKLLKSYHRIAIKYVFNDVKTTLFIVLSISIGSSLFIGTYYRSNLERIMIEHDKKVHFLNGDYLLKKVEAEPAKMGISEKTVKEIQKIKGVTGVETQRVMPIRVLDNCKVKRNKPYHDFMEKMIEDTKYKSFTRNDGVNDVYSSELIGFNKCSLEKLHSYLLEGDYNPNNLKGNKAILFMPLTVKANSSDRSQAYFKNGFYVMDYEIGDIVTIKYRTDLDTSSNKYWAMKDKNAEYTYKKFEIMAIVYYPYMDLMTFPAYAYPRVIISDNQYKKLINLNVYSRVNVNVNKSLGNGYLNDIEEKLIRLSVQNQGSSVTTISIIEQKRNMDKLYRKQLIYAYGMAIVVLVLAFINVINNLKYRIQTRKKELCIYRAIGMNYNTVCRMIRFENLMVVLISILITSVVSGPVTKYLYGKSDISKYNVMYQNDYRTLAIVNILTLIICYTISMLVTKELRNDNIVEYIEDIE